VSETLRQPCAGPEIPETFASAADLGTFAVRQEAARQVCDERRAGLVSLIDAVNAVRK
jgi:hypothetical protein